MNGQLVAIASSVLSIGVLAFGVYAFTRSKASATLVQQATPEGAKDALDRLADWAKWMSGIQTATLGAVGLLTKQGDHLQRPPAAVATVVWMGAALFCSAWVLSSLPSITLRVTATPPAAGAAAGAYDVYEQPLYGLTTIRLSYLLIMQHWLWAAGLVGFGWFLLGL